MNKVLHYLSAVLLAATVLLCAFVPSRAAAWAASEYTQVLNNIQLAASVAKQATMVSEQIASKITLIQQYQTMLMNLKSIPQEVLSSTLAPYQAQLAAFNQLQGSVNALKNASENARAMMDLRDKDYRMSGLKYGDYMKYEVALANQRGGIYRQRMDQDIAAMDSMREKSNALRELSQQTSGITGNVQGLQQLSQLSSVSAGELMEIKASLLAQSADRNQDKAAAETSVSEKGTSLEVTSKGADSRASRNSDVKNKLTDPFTSTWKGLEPQK
jgi:conjugal transfer/entry exclusion protein